MIYVALIAVLYAGSCMGQMGGMGGGMGGMGGAGGCAIDQKCFSPCPDYTLADAFPFIRQTPISCEDCQKLCNKLQAGTPPFTCQSAVYDAQVGSCDIFAVSDQSSGGIGRRKRGGGGGGGGGGFNSGGADFGNGGGGGGGGKGGQKVPHKQKYPGRIYLQPTGFCAGQGGNDTGSSTTASSGGSGASGSSASGSETTTAATTTTTAAMKKKIRDQAPIRRKDDSGAATRCVAHRFSNNRKDCSTGVRWVNMRRQLCKPTKAECDAS